MMEDSKKGIDESVTDRKKQNEHALEFKTWAEIGQIAYFLGSSCFAWQGDRLRIAGEAYFAERFKVSITVNKC